MELTFPQLLKLKILEHGITISPSAEQCLTGNGSHQLITHDYATTGGLTLVFEDNIYVNCPIGDWFCDHPVGELIVSPGGEFALHAEGQYFPARHLPLPAYISRDKKTALGVMTHADRVRLSPIEGCACSCNFCDWSLRTYTPQDLDVQINGLAIACSDNLLPPRHVLVSGGTPRRNDEKWLDDFYKKVVNASSLPVDVMLMPRTDLNIIDELVIAGVHGFSINIELFDTAIAAKLCPQKSRLGLAAYEETISRAVKLTGGKGRVRSLLLVGLEPEESTLEGVEFIARLGADPVLSPFRPALGTDMASVRPPSADMMANIFLASKEIAERYGVKLGPRCIPCMHNTITFPDGSPEYYLS